jgi:hypothetical protein
MIARLGLCVGVVRFLDDTPFPFRSRPARFKCDELLCIPNHPKDRPVYPFKTHLQRPTSEKAFKSESILRHGLDLKLHP